MHPSAESNGWAPQRGVSTQVIGYVRVSTDGQAESGAGMAAQRSAIQEACQVRSLVLSRLYEDAGFSAANLDRPALSDALAALATRKADGLIVAKLDRLSRSLLDFAQLMELARAQGWALIALDLGVDTTTPSGELLAGVLASFAQFERRLISQRTREGLAAKRAAGVTLGRPRNLPACIVDRIQDERRAKRSLTAIADGLSRDNVPTAQGGRRWYPSTVRAVLVSRAADPSSGKLAPR